MRMRTYIDNEKLRIKKICSISAWLLGVFIMSWIWLPWQIVIIIICVISFIFANQYWKNTYQRTDNKITKHCCAWHKQNYGKDLMIGYEDNLEDNSHGNISHGICPKCLKKLENARGK